MFQIIVGTMHDCTQTYERIIRPRETRLLQKPVSFFFFFFYRKTEEKKSKNLYARFYWGLSVEIIIG